MEAIVTFIEIIWNLLLLIPKMLLALFPLYNTLSGLKQDLIAAALGVSPFVIWLIIKVFSLLKHFSK